MSSRPGSPKSKKPAQGGQHRGPRSATRNLNRSEERALRVRAAATAAAQTAALDDVPAPRARPVDAPTRRGSRQVVARGQSGPRLLNMTRDQEYSVIRHDLRRLLIISGALFVAMVVLLLVLPR